MKNIKFKGNIVCFCGQIYEFKDMYILVKSLNFYKINCNEILNFYLEKNKDKCCICLRNFKNKLFECKASDVNLSINKDFIHYFCQDCINTIKNNNLYAIQCNLCESNHTIQEIIHS